MGRGSGIDSFIASLAERTFQTREGFKATLYRAGDLENPTDYGIVHGDYMRADALKPEGRPGRMDGLFCSMGFNGLARWFRANRSCQLPYSPWEINYLGPEPFAYPIEVWEAAQSLSTDRAYEAFWACGVPLSVALAEPSKYQDARWEILIDPAYIKSARPVSKRRLIEKTPDIYAAKDMMRDFFPALYKKGVIYGSENREALDPPLDAHDEDLARKLMRELRQAGRT